MAEITEKQKCCLRAIAEYVSKHGMAPTRRELSELTGQKSVNGVRQMLSSLEKKGFIKIEPKGYSRNIIILRIPERQLALIQ